jgi:hypothetical protein
MRQRRRRRCEGETWKMNGSWGLNRLNCCEMRDMVLVVFMGGFWVYQ